MALSNIVINGVSASYVEVPINTTVNISNDGDGGESSIVWSAITGSQPSGSYDGFTGSPTTFATTFIAKKEGNYVINHLIDSSITGSCVLVVRHLKSDLISPAAGEKRQHGSETGWARSLQAIHKKVDNLIADGGTVVGYANESLLTSDIIRVTGAYSAKRGLPGEELTPVFARISGEATGSFQGTVYLVEGPVSGSSPILSGSLFTARLHGLHGPLTGTVSDGDFVFGRSDGTISPNLDIVDRKLGTVVGTAGSVYYINFDGTSDLRPGSGAGVTSLAVVNIDDPSVELNLINGSKGETRLCYQVSLTADEWTLYVWDDADSDAESVPHRVDGLTGVWIAIAGKYNNGGVNLAGDVTLGLSQRLTLDDDADTYIVSTVDDNIGFFAGAGAERVRVTNGDVLVWADIRPASDYGTNLGTLTRRFENVWTGYTSMVPESQVSGSTEISGSRLANEGAATVDVVTPDGQQYSPMLVFNGAGWDENLAQTADVRGAIQVQPEQGSATFPTFNMFVKARIEGANSDAYFDVLQLKSGFVNASTFMNVAPNDAGGASINLGKLSNNIGITGTGSGINFRMGSGTYHQMRAGYLNVLVASSTTTQAAVSLTEADTGLYHPATDTVGILSNGREGLSIGPSLTASFSGDISLGLNHKLLFDDDGDTLIYCNSDDVFRLEVGGSSVFFVSGAGTHANFATGVSPQSNGNADLGLVSNRWGEAWVQNLDVSGSLSLTGSIEIIHENVTNQPIINATKVGAGTTGIELNYAAGGLVNAFGTAGNTIHTRLSNRTMNWTVDNNAFDSSPQAFLFVNESTLTRSTMAVKRAAGQWRPIQRWEDESGVMLAQVDESGSFVTSGSAGSLLREITQAGTISTDCSKTNSVEVNLTGSAVLGNPTGMKSGHTYIWMIKQAATVTGSLTYGTEFKFPLGIAPSLTIATADTVDILTGVCSGSTIFASMNKEYK